MVQSPLRKQLSAPGLLQSVRRCFEKVGDGRDSQCAIPLVDVLMSGLAVFSLKYPSLLQFDRALQSEKIVRSNLKTLFGVDRAPCDTQLRTRLDRVQPNQLHAAFREIHRHLQRGKALEAYQYHDGHYLLSIDGTGHFASSTVHCSDCCTKVTKGTESYYHQLLGAVLVHPDQKTVLPIGAEPITRHDGSTKNDCERSAAKRLLPRTRTQYPKLKLIVIDDALASNGPHIELLKSLDMRFILGVKPGDHVALFESVRQRINEGRAEEFSHFDEAGTEHGYRWCTAMQLNKSHPELRVNFLEYWEIRQGKQRIWSWVTDLELRRETVESVMRGGRARWKIENETFNTLKNQGYHLEHNYGHGVKHLATNFALLTMLAFLIDQAQELGCRLFQQAYKKCQARITLWERIRALFSDYYIPDWETLWAAIINGPAGAVLMPSSPDTS